MRLSLINEWQMARLVDQYDLVAGSLPKDIAIGYALAKEYVEPSRANIAQLNFVLEHRTLFEIPGEVADESCDVQS